MPRLDGVVFRFGTAMAGKLLSPAEGVRRGEARVNSRSSVRRQVVDYGVAAAGGAAVVAASGAGAEAAGGAATSGMVSAGGGVAAAAGAAGASTGLGVGTAAGA